MRSVFVAITAAMVLGGVAQAQWLHIPLPSTPRTADGKPNLAAPVPRTQDGTPDLSGIWNPGRTFTGKSPIVDIAADLKDVPFQPWAAALYKSRLDSNSKDDPTAHCVVGGAWARRLSAWR